MAENTPLDIVTSDAGDIYDQTIRALSDAVGEPLYPGDERRMFGEALVAVLVSTHNLISDAARQTALSYARGEVLDALGERLGVTRLGGTAATTVLQFTLSAARDVATVIPKWTKATPDTQVYFATDTDAVISAGETAVNVPATCTGVGALGNGFIAGAVSTIVDKIPYVESVTNLSETKGGSDGELYDDDGDARFRERIRIAVSALSVAGPVRAYEYWAKTADAGIADVSVISEAEDFEAEYEVVDEKVYIGGDLLLPDECLIVDGKEEGFSYTYKDSLLVITISDEESKVKPKVSVKLRHKMDGRVRIVPLMKDGKDPTDDVLERILETCSADDVRPMTDLVTVGKPTRKPYDIDLCYWVTPEAEGSVVRAIEGEGGAIERFVKEQDSRLGRDINPDMLESYIMEAGAIRVDITKPLYTPLAPDEAAKYSNSLTVSHKLETQARWER